MSGENMTVDAKLREALEKIYRLNAGRDCDIAWLCKTALQSPPQDSVMCSDCGKGIPHGSKCEHDERKARIAELDDAVAKLEMVYEAFEGYHDYDAGSMNDYGGGNVSWWFDYIRVEVGRANEWWRSRIDDVLTALDKPPHQDTECTGVPDCKCAACVEDALSNIAEINREFHQDSAAGETVEEWTQKRVAAVKAAHEKAGDSTLRFGEDATRSTISKSRAKRLAAMKRVAVGLYNICPTCGRRHTRKSRECAECWNKQPTPPQADQDAQQPQGKGG